MFLFGYITEVMVERGSMLSRPSKVHKAGGE
jgi:hypothetical protein